MQQIKKNKEILSIANSQIPKLLAALNVDFSKSGNWLMAPCPIHHGDNRHGFGFNTSKGYWVCFTNHCEAEWGRTILDLVAGVLKYSSGDAVEWILENANEDEKFFVPSEKKEDRIFRETCLQRLFRTDFYLKRGFKQSTLDNFEHGLAESDVMLGRVVFPIRDEKGNIRGFSGRWAGKEAVVDGKIKCFKNNKEVAKWRHTSFNKSEYLYNFYKAKEYAKKELIIVESIGNVMRWWEVGFKNSVACLGSFLTAQQIALILPCTETVILAYDNDKAGEKNRKNSEKKLEQYVKIAHLIPPVGKDWADLTNEETMEIYENQYKRKQT